MGTKQILNKDLISDCISTMRFPLAVLVVFIHSFGYPKAVDTLAIDYTSLTLTNVYDLLRVAVSHVIAHSAVPTFFLISGYLFFRSMQQWNTAIWKRKMQSRIHTIVIPYILWISVYVAYILLQKAAGIVLYEKPWSNISDYLAEQGWLHIYWDSYRWNIDRVNLLGWQTPSSAPALVPFWFMRDLIVVFLFTPVIHWCVCKFRAKFILALFVCYILQLWVPVSGLSITATFFFSFGAWCSITGKDTMLMKRWLKMACGIATMLLFPIMVYYDGHNTDMGNRLYPVFVFLLVISAIFFFIRLTSNRKILIINVIQEMGGYSFFIFASHIFVLEHISWLINKTLSTMGTIGDIIAYLFTPLLTIAICIFICRIMLQYAPKLSKILGCR